MSKHKDKLPGGLADKKKPSDFDPTQLKKGIKHELEHTSDRSVAQEIAMDHLSEDPKYYDHLDEIRKFIRLLIKETWGQRPAKYMATPETIDNSDDEYDPDDMNPYKANDELETVKANAHPKTQHAGVMKGSGRTSGGRIPGGKNQGYSGK